MNRVAVILVVALSIATVARPAGAASGVVRLDGETPGTHPTFEILSEHPQGLTLKFTLPALNVDEVHDKGKTFQIVSIPGGHVTGGVGRSALPTLTRFISVPSCSEIELQVTETAREILRGYDLAAAEADPDMKPDDVPLVELGTPAVMRDLRIVPLRVRPVRHGTADRTLEVCRSMTVDIRFAGQNSGTVKGQPRRMIASSFDRLYHSLVVNYQGPADGQSLGFGGYLMICPDDTTVTRLVQPLLEWRSRMGYVTALATLADVGGATSGDVKDYIQNAYDTWACPPEYIVLVGDARYAGLITPTCYAYPRYYDGEGDYAYVLLEGDDMVPDAHIGRISVADVDQLEYVIDKILRYETVPYVADPDWFLGACLIADAREPTLGSGVTCRHVIQWVKQGLERNGYTRIDEIYEEPFPNQFTASINQGASIMAYRGYEPMSGIFSSVIRALDNGEMLPFAVPLTCHTGSFAAPVVAQTEAFLRAGSPGAPAGAIGAIGMSTNETYTRTNNVSMYGIFQGLLYEGISDIGAVLARGKAELFLHFGHDDPALAEGALWRTNLIGDPATRCWTAPPGALSVSYPDSLPVGTTAVSVTVTDEMTGLEIEDACVCLWKDGETHVSGFTGAGGTIDLCVDTPTAGEMRVTVTKPNHAPHLGDVHVGPALLDVVVDKTWYLDNGSPSSQGFYDPWANPGDTITFTARLRNQSWSFLHNVNVVVRSPDPFVTIIDSTFWVGQMAPDETASSFDEFVFKIDAGCPNRHLIPLFLEIRSSEGTRPALLEVPVGAPAFEYLGHECGSGKARMEAGESTTLHVTLAFTGDSYAEYVAGTLLSLSCHLTVVNSLGHYRFGSPQEGWADSTTNHGEPFSVSASPDCYPGRLAPCLLTLETSSGALDSVAFALKIGTAQSTDPLGPDTYGYMAFDNTDTAYAEAPVYEWFEIAGNHGGPGMDIGLRDTSDYWLGGADHTILDLPFPFTYYGVAFDSVTIAADGWLSMGTTHLENCWNTMIPGAGGPDAMIAPFWEDMYQVPGAGVGGYYDTDRHPYGVEWSRLMNKADPPQEQTFQVILFDPVFHPTPTGDGEILFQYHTISNDEGHQAYATAGIENLDHSDGLLYTYFNWYPDGAAELAPGRAVRILPVLSALPEPADPWPPATRLYPNFPNPFNPTTTLRYDLSRPERVGLRILDVTGRLVRILVHSEYQEIGPYVLEWDGLDDAGRAVAPGVYFLHFQAGNDERTQKMVLLK